MAHTVGRLEPPGKLTSFDSQDLCFEFIAYFQSLAGFGRYYPCIRDIRVDYLTDSVSL